MPRRSTLLPELLPQRALAVSGQAEAAVRFFRFPSDANAFSAARSAKVRRREHQLAVQALRGLRRPRREELLSLLRFLGDCLEETSQAVAEANRFEIGADGGLLCMAQDISKAVSELSAAMAVFGDGQRCQEHLLKAKRHADEVERRRHRKKAHGPGNFAIVYGLKSAAVARRLSQAAAAVSSAVDLLGELLAVEAA